jgi:hypothetical protein
MFRQAELVNMQQFALNDRRHNQPAAWRVELADQV